MIQKLLDEPYWAELPKRRENADRGGKGLFLIKMHFGFNTPSNVTYPEVLDNLPLLKETLISIMKIEVVSIRHYFHHPLQNLKITTDVQEKLSALYEASITENNLEKTYQVIVELQKFKANWSVNRQVKFLAGLL